MAGLADPEEGPLWDSIKRQLYRSEVSHVKRLVGESLIQQNRVMWDELASLRQILASFEAQNDELTERSKKQVQFSSTQHRELLRRQAQILMDDVSSQAAACGFALADLVPDLKDGMPLRDFFFSSSPPEKTTSCSSPKPFTFQPSCRPTPPRTPSTRPSSSSGLSRCSTPDLGSAPLPLGRQLGIDELAPVAEGIREALEAESEALLAAIGEQMQRFEAEEARRASTVAARGQGQGPTTAELQQLVHKLQDLAVSPSLRSLAIAGPASPRAGAHLAGAFDPSDGGALAVQPIGGGASVRRLKALIAQRRTGAGGALLTLDAVPETRTSTSVHCGENELKPFDPFFDDPFA